jgi:hypothetical protein
VDKVLWLGRDGVREYPKEIIKEAEKLLSQEDKYIEAVVEAWRRRKTIEVDDLEFVPSRLGVEVYRDGDYETAWRNKAIESAFFGLQVRDSLTRKPKDKKVSDEDQVDVDIVVNVEKPEQEKEDEEDLEED